MRLQFSLHHRAAPLVGRVMLDLVAGWDYEAVGGLTLGADPVATAMLHAKAAEGGRLDAFVVRKSDVSEDELLAFVAENVAPYKRIRFVEFIDAVPKSASGKILRRVLKGQ